MNAQQNCQWIGHGIAGIGGTVVELDNTSTLIGKLKVRRDELKRLIAAQEANKAELVKIERMLEAAEGPHPVEGSP